MDRRLNGSGSLNYMGVNATTPANTTFHDRPPTANDYISFMLGDIWIDNSSMKASPPVAPTANNIWTLMSVAGGVAVWVNSGSLQSLSGSTNPLVKVQPDATGNINLTTTTPGMTIVGTTPGTVAIDISGGIGANTFIPDSGGAVTPDAFGDITFKGVLGHTTTVGDPLNNIINWDIDESVPTSFLANTDFAIPVANQLSVVGGTDISTVGNTSNTITINTTGLKVSRFDTDEGSATPVDGIINMVGADGIWVKGDGNTITITYPGTPPTPTPTLIKTTTFTANGTWTKDPLAATVVVWIWSGGGAGGSGISRPGLSKDGFGGGGGGAGSLVMYTGAATASEAIVVGAGGVPGVSNGGTSAFGVHVGTPSGINGNNGGLFGGGAGGAGWLGLNGALGQSEGATSTSTTGATGGGGGGFCTQYVLYNGGAGGSNSDGSGGAGGVGGNGAAGHDGSTYAIAGTGGGGGGCVALAPGKAGGVGGIPSGGGGGGACAYTVGQPGGAGGAGGRGQVTVLEYSA